MINARRQTRPTRPAFTLIELLVVVCIIVVLMAMLIPAVTATHDQMMTVKCLSNLRQIGYAISRYALDNENCLVPGDYFGYQDSFGQAGGGSWEDILEAGGYVKVPTLHTATDTAIYTDDDYRVNFDNDYLFRCPTGVYVDVMPGQAGYNFPTTQTDPLGMLPSARASDITLDVVCTWYAANLAPNQEASGLQPLPFNFLPDWNPTNGKMDWTINRFTKFHDASQLPLIFDGFWMFWNNPAFINARHGNRTTTNLLFADFHCENQLTSSLPNANWYVK
jgi:prepilin-type N-terminal cleavage/methylation domain-containing protein/prepilin-type processing-associated H-X9-DG protein